MSDFGLTLALQNMYSGPSQQEKNRNEFANLQQMQSYFENQKKKKEEAALKMQLYDENVAKFADTLLASDRNKIFQKSRVLRSTVREMIKENGGDLQSFFANGGHEVLANYKNSIIQSEESSQYLENKQNMTMIMKAMNEGKSHLISPIDKANFDAYFANKGGRITYSGMMNDIKMPDPNKYNYGEKIPYQDILDENKAVIMANYAIYHRGTSSDPTVSGKVPSNEELLAFTAAMYGTATGSNYQKRIADDELVIRKNQEMRQQDLHPYERQAKEIANAQGIENVKGTQLENEGRMLDNMQKEYNLEYSMTGGSGGNGNGSGGSGGSGGATGSGPMTDAFGLGTGQTVDEYSAFNDIAASLTDFNQDDSVRVNNVYNAAQKMMKSNNFFGGITNGIWKGKAVAQANYDGDGWKDWWSSDSTDMKIKGAIGNTFKPTVAYSLFKNEGDASTFSSFVAQQVGAKYENRMIKGFAPKVGMKGVFSADGSSLEYGHRGLHGELNDTHAGDYKVVGTILAPTVTGPKGKQMIMNVNGKLATNAYKKTDKARMSAFTVIEKDGVRFYLEADPTDPTVREKLQKPFDYTKSQYQYEITSSKINQSKKALEASKKEFNVVRSQIGQNPNFQKAALQISPNGTYSNGDFLNSYYMVLKQTRPDLTYDEIVNNSSILFLEMINKAGDNLLGKMKMGTISPAKFFEIMKNKAGNPQELETTKLWEKTFYNIKYNAK